MKLSPHVRSVIASSVEILMRHNVPFFPERCLRALKCSHDFVSLPDFGIHWRSNEWECCQGVYIWE